MNFEQARINMVEQQVRPWDVLDANVLNLMNTLPREDFVPKGYRNLAYADTQISLGHDQVMLPPREVGRIVQALQVQPGETVLEVGTGSGYLTTLLALEAKEVLSVELFPDIAANAQQHCQTYGNIKIETGDAASGWATASKFDVICITGALPSLARHWKEQLNIGGRLFVVIGKPPIMQAMLITRMSSTEWNTHTLYETLLPWLAHAEPVPEFEF